ncbi:cysteine desulfurase family protein [Papillibacter cinnamivorans]|uniref:Cysteine desulfurase n=1 Tax=Papillibacter cinnamivorans DSM 12816 TaxID=1122930 RepID=A0A1W2ANJ6_9FIRM|nr:aminotransferase class V-fold PLP-dependent enzyme [Papillibacter cinnamivorans]SMC62174.1 cysteine desulfurase [Papillibacter cinnamivorans DSM 12816]
MSIYLDYNASSPVEPRVLEAMVDIYKNNFGNADSRTHDFGDHARSVVETARKQVSSLLGVSTSEVFFTSGATESNNIAIQGLQTYALESGKNHIITTSIEHKAVMETVKVMSERGFIVDFIDPESSGRINVAKVLKKVCANTLLVSLMHVNNETGIIQPVKELGEELSKQNVLFHVDATQSCGKLVQEIRELKYNMLSFSAHKLRGPQGVGVLVLRKKEYKLPPVKAIMYGGQQEHGIRPGTIPVALVGGCGKACEIAEIEYKKDEAKLSAIKMSLLKLLEDSGLSYSFNGDQKYCLNNTLNLCLHGVSSEALMISTKQYCSVSNGSACTSKNYSPSYVLVSMGIPIEQIENSIRISWGPETNMGELEKEFFRMLSVAKSLAE